MVIILLRCLSKRWRTEVLNLLSTLRCLHTWMPTHTSSELALHTLSTHCSWQDGKGIILGSNLSALSSHQHGGLFAYFKNGEKLSHFLILYVSLCSSPALCFTQCLTHALMSHMVAWCFHLQSNSKIVIYDINIIFK